MKIQTYSDAEIWVRNSGITNLKWSTNTSAKGFTKYLYENWPEPCEEDKDLENYWDITEKANKLFFELLTSYLKENKL